MLYFVTLQVNLEGQQQCEDELVVFIKASYCVSEHLKGQVINNVCNSLLSFRGLFRPAKTIYESNNCKWTTNRNSAARHSNGTK